jgi:hypothetical protein
MPVVYVRIGDINFGCHVWMCFWMTWQIFYLKINAVNDADVAGRVLGSSPCVSVAESVLRLSSHVTKPCVANTEGTTCAPILSVAILLHSTMASCVAENSSFHKQTGYQFIGTSFRGGNVHFGGEITGFHALQTPFPFANLLLTRNAGPSRQP